VLDAAERAANGIREDAQAWAQRYLEESRRRADGAAEARIREISELTDNLVNRARAVAQQSDELIAALDDAGRRVFGAARPGETAQDQQPPPAFDATGAQQGVTQPPPPPATPPPEYSPPPAAPAAPAAPPPPAASEPVQPGPPAGPPPRAVPPPEPTPASAPPEQPPVDPPPAFAPPVSPPSQQAPPPAAGPSQPISEGARLLATQMAVAGSTRDEIAWRLQEEFGIQDSSAILAEIGI
jgi:hypothetical protein